MSLQPNIIIVIIVEDIIKALNKIYISLFYAKKLTFRNASF